ncbi:MAG: DUF3429 domain-containing protein [Alphaproteobacteria bacterium]|nr:DUF3429 domain-containing protein [Alphaproteobacteria bacterium]
MRDVFIPRFALALTLLGTMPFVGLSVGISLDKENTEGLLQPLFIYGAVMLSFLGGIHWGFAMTFSHAGQTDASLLLHGVSVLFVLVAWGVFFLQQPYLRLLAFAFFFAVAWGVDSLLYSHQMIPLWYFNLRGIVTPIVVVSMYVAYFSVI